MSPKLRNNNPKKTTVPEEDLSDDEKVTKKKDSSNDGNDDNDDKEDDDKEGDMFAEVKRILAGHINPDVRAGYHRSLIRFIKFLYAKKNSKFTLFHVLHDDLLNDMDQVNTAIKGYNSELSETIRHHLENATADYHPINLRELDPQVFSKFLSETKKNAKGTYKSNKKVQQKAPGYLKSYGGIRSALSFLFTECEVMPTAKFNNHMKRFMKGIRKASAKERGRKGGSSMNDGKAPMPFEVYRLLCKLLLEDEDTKSAFAHCFLTMTWNLMCRSRNTVNVQVEHINWDADAIGVKFAHSKMDQEGDRSAQLRHIYANPLIPEICPVLSLARYRLACPGITAGELFPGNNQYDRFRKLLSTLVHDHADEIRRLGVDPNDIGVHSIRKGAATYCCNGTTSGVNFAAVCVRAGWSMGGVIDRYLQHEGAGDQVCGRTVAGLNVSTYEFGISPPFFDCTGKPEMEAAIDTALQVVFGKEPVEFHLLSRFLLSSLLYHKQYLLEHIHNENRTRKLFFFETRLLSWKVSVNL